MSANDNSDARLDAPVPQGGVLAALPRTRPQRASARRAAARGRASTSETVAPAAKAKRTKKIKATTKTKTKTKTKTEPAAPKQGYEPEEELELGHTVNPPSGTELVESLADIVGELATTGLTAGGRLLKDAFSILRRP